MKQDILEKLHTSHLGIVKCRERARQSVWWPGLSTQLVQMIKNCRECCKERSQPAEPLITLKLPELPFQKIGTDLSEWEKRTYLLVVDYYSRYIEIALLKRTTSSEVITHLKSIFARHGIPELIVSDNGPHYSVKSFRNSCKNTNVDLSPAVLVPSKQWWGWTCRSAEEGGWPTSGIVNNPTEQLPCR